LTNFSCKRGFIKWERKL